MANYLLDTNHASALLRGIDKIKEKIERERGSRFGIPMTVLGELYFGAYASRYVKENLENLANFVRKVIIWDYDREAAEEFGKIQAEQKTKGKPIPALDAQIAAVARIHKLTVLTTDQHFRFIDGISVENWLE